MDDGSRHELLSRNPEKLRQTLAGLKSVVEKFTPVFLRISPQESYDHARRIYQVIRDSGVVSVVFVPNTWPGYRPLSELGEPILEVPGGVGGKSGPATAKESAQQTKWAVELLSGSKIEVVSSSGIKSSQELKQRLGLGAIAGVGTTFYYEPETGWQEDTSKLVHGL
jgi:dihydroorotate dehydrogenase